MSSSSKPRPTVKIPMANSTDIRQTNSTAQAFLGGKQKAWMETAAVIDLVKEPRSGSGTPPLVSPSARPKRKRPTINSRPTSHTPETPNSPQSGLFASASTTTTAPLQLPPMSSVPSPSSVAPHSAGPVPSSTNLQSSLPASLPSQSSPTSFPPAVASSEANALVPLEAKAHPTVQVPDSNSPLSIGLEAAKPPLGATTEPPVLPVPGPTPRTESIAGASSNGPKNSPAPLVREQVQLSSQGPPARKPSVPGPTLQTSAGRNETPDVVEIPPPTIQRRDSRLQHAATTSTIPSSTSSRGNGQGSSQYHANLPSGVAALRQMFPFRRNSLGVGVPTAAYVPPAVGMAVDPSRQQPQTYNPTANAMAKQPRSKPTLMDALPRLEQLLDKLGGRDKLQYAPELSRIEPLENACRHDDFFYLTIHQLYCLEYLGKLGPNFANQVPGLAGAAAAAQPALELIFSWNGRLPVPLIDYFANFPGPIEKLFQVSTMYRGSLLRAPQFLERLAAGWMSFVQGCRERGAPPLNYEIDRAFRTRSIMLQTTMFRSVLLDMVPWLPFRWYQRLRAVHADDQLLYCQLVSRLGTATAPTPYEIQGINQRTREAFTRVLDEMSQEERERRRPSGGSGHGSGGNDTKPGPKPQTSAQSPRMASAAAAALGLGDKTLPVPSTTAFQAANDMAAPIDLTKMDSP